MRPCQILKILKRRQEKERRKGAMDGENGDRCKEGGLFIRGERIQN